jgi:hypothetical protein
MRLILLILILVVIALLVAVGTGLLNVSQTRTAKAPDVSINRAGVSASGGRAPTFDIETGSVSVGTRRRNVAVPTVSVNPPVDSNQQESNATANAG